MSALHFKDVGTELRTAGYRPEQICSIAHGLTAHKYREQLSQGHIQARYIG
jgi:hypothetical protein